MKNALFIVVIALGFGNIVADTAKKSVDSEVVVHDHYYLEGQKRATELIQAFVLYAKGNIEKSKKRKESVFKKHGETLTKLNEKLSLPWLYQAGIYRSSNPLKTDDQKQAFIEARNYFKGMGEKMKAFNLEHYLKKHKIKKDTQNLTQTYTFLAEKIDSLAKIEDFAEAFDALKQLGDDIKKISKALWQ